MTFLSALELLFDEHVGGPIEMEIDRVYHWFEWTKLYLLQSAQ